MAEMPRHGNPPILGQDAEETKEDSQNNEENARQTTRIRERGHRRSIYADLIDIPAAKRKNVSKFVIRRLLRSVNHDPTKYKGLIQRGDLTCEDFSRIMQLCQKINKIEKHRLNTQQRRNYTQLIERIYADRPFLLVFSQLLEDVVKELEEQRRTKITSDNQEIYLRTLLYLQQVAYRCLTEILLATPSTERQPPL